MAAGTASFEVRHAFDGETIAGTTNATPTFKTLHVPVKWDGASTRLHQTSQVSGGAHFGDALLTKDAAGKLEGSLVYGVYDPILETLFQSSWATDAMTDGKAVKTCTFETSFAAGVGGGTKYLRYRGVEAVKGSLKGKSGGELQFSLDFMGMEVADVLTSAIAGATYTDPTNKDPLVSAADFGALTFAGYTLDDMESFSIDFDYADRTPQRKMGGVNLIGITRGAFRPVINASFYVGANVSALRDAAHANTQTAAKFTINIGSVTLKKYRVEFWNCYVDWAHVNWDQPTGFLDVRIIPAYTAANSGVMTLTRAIV